jgi:hypothetical protein
LTLLSVSMQSDKLPQTADSRPRKALKGAEKMTDFSGSASSKIQSQTMVSVPGQEDRQLGVAVLAGVHTTSDRKFDKAKITYVGTAETVNGDGEQRGYFQNVHPNGDTSHGTFEAKVRATGTAVTLGGTWRFAGGTGSLSRLKGGGIFKSEMTSPTTSEMTWSGSYEA